MMRVFLTICLSLIATGAFSSRAAEPAASASEAILISPISRTNAVDFMNEVVPILKKSCLACHNTTTAKASLVLETPTSILKGGETGPAIIPGKGAESLLMKVASHQLDPFMPPKNNKANALPLTPNELGLLKVWIDQGATGTVSLALGPVHWQSLPKDFNPINAVAVSRDGRYAACNRANKLFLYYLPSNEMSGVLSDPALAGSGDSEIADQDLIQSLAFSPDGNRLAAGGFRAVRIWRREPQKELFTAAIGTNEAAGVSADGKWLALAGPNHELSLWDLESHQKVKEIAKLDFVVRSIRFSPELRMLAVGGDDKKIRFWTLPEGEIRGEIVTPSEVRSLAWIPKLNKIAAGGADGVIRLWKLPSDAGEFPTQPLSELTGHKGIVTALDSVAAKEAQLLSGGIDGTVRHWDLDRNKQLRQMDHGSPVAAVCIRPDGKRFASAGDGNGARIWDTDSGKSIAELKGNYLAQEFLAAQQRELTFAKKEVAFHKTVLESAEKDQKAETEALKKVTETKALAEKALSEKQEASKRAAEEKASADKLAESFGAAAKIALQNKGVAEKLATLIDGEIKMATERLASTRKASEQVAAAKSAAYKAAIDAAGTNKTAGAEFAIDKAASAKLALDQSLEAISSAEQFLADLVTKSNTVTETKVAAEKANTTVAAELKTAEAKVKSMQKTVADASEALKKADSAKGLAEQNYQSTLAVSKNADTAVAAAKSALANAEKETEKVELAVADARKKEGETQKPVRSVAFASDNQTVITSGDDLLIHTWDASSGKPYEILTNESKSPFLVANLPGRRVLALGSSANCWALESRWKLEKTIGSGGDKSPLLDRVLALEFSPDGKWLATGGGVPSRSGEVKIWEVESGKMIIDLKDPHSDTVFSLAFSTDGKYLASSAADKFVKIFEASSGKFVRGFEGHTGHVLGLSWEKDGRTLGSCGADKVVKIWDFVHGEQKKTIEGFTKEVTSIHFIPGTNEAIVSAGDSVVKRLRDDGSNLRTFNCGTDFIESAGVSDDGAVVVAGGQDGILRVWNGTTGELIQSFERAVAQPAGNLSASR